jgi:hypothetical protein
MHHLNTRTLLVTKGDYMNFSFLSTDARAFLRASAFLVILGAAGSATAAATCHSTSTQNGVTVTSDQCNTVVTNTNNNGSTQSSVNSIGSYGGFDFSMLGQIDPALAQIIQPQQAPAQLPPTQLPPTPAPSTQIPSTSVGSVPSLSSLPSLSSIPGLSSLSGLSSLPSVSAMPNLGAMPSLNSIPSIPQLDLSQFKFNFASFGF